MNVLILDTILVIASIATSLFTLSWSAKQFILYRNLLNDMKNEIRKNITRNRKIKK
jgi:hypothetical protein